MQRGGGIPMKKVAAFGVTLVLSMTLTVFPAMAHGHGHGHRARTSTQDPVCSVENCSEAGHHYHDGDIYCGYHHEGGYCDGSCAAVSSDYGYGGCHHGGHC